MGNDDKISSTGFDGNFGTVGTVAVIKPLGLFLLLTLLLCFVSCKNRSSMDKKTAEMLEKRYGQVVSVDVSKSGTLSKAIKEFSGEEKISYLRVSGPINGADIDSLKTISQSIRALDLLDATIESGVPYHDYDDEKAIPEDNVIGEDMFNFNRLEHIYLPIATTKIEDNAFSYCSNIETIRIPSNVVSIGSRAFYGCRSLTSLQLPDKLASIGESAFSDCNSLKRLRIPKTVNTFDVGAFCKASDLYLEWSPEELDKLGELDFSWMWLNDNPPRQLSSHFVFRSPTLHVPTAYVKEYKEKFPKSNVVADEDTGDEAYQPTFLVEKGHVGPVNVGPIDNVPIFVAGLYDKYEKGSEVVPEGGNEEMEVIRFIKDGKLVFKGILNGDAISAFYVYPEASNVSTILNFHAGGNVSDLTLVKDVFKWSKLNSELMYCTIGYLNYFVDVDCLKDGYKNKISLSDFTDGSKVRFIKVQ